MYRYDEPKGDKTWFRLLCFVLDFYLCFQYGMCQSNYNASAIFLLKPCV